MPSNRETEKNRPLGFREYFLTLRLPKAQQNELKQLRDKNTAKGKELSTAEIPRLARLESLQARTIPNRRNFLVAAACIGLVCAGYPSARSYLAGNNSAGKKVLNAEIQAKEIKLEFLRKLEKLPEVQSSPELLAVIEVVRTDYENILKRSRSLQVANQQVRSGMLHEILSEDGPPPVEVLKEDGKVTGYIYESMADVPMHKMFQSQALSEEERFIVDIALSLIREVFGEDHQVVKASNELPIQRAKYRIGIMVNGKPGAILGTVRPSYIDDDAKELENPGTVTILMFPDPIAYKNTHLECIIYTAGTLVEELYHASDPNLRDALTKKESLAK